MGIERNVGGRDRLLRAGLAVTLLAVAGFGLRAGRRRVATVAAVGAAALGFNALAGVCGLNALLGIDTTDD